MTWDVSNWIVTQTANRTIDATLDLRPLLSCGNAEVLCQDLGWKDGIHWGKKGHQVVGEALHKALFADCE
jgi:lysophospholipase L1-like esterase